MSLNESDIYWTGKIKLFWGNKRRWETGRWGLALFLFIVLGCFPLFAEAQENSDAVVRDTVSRTPFKNRIGFRTNVVDWLFTIPNVGVELEVGKSKYYRNPYTVSLVGRYNWNSRHDYLPSMVFNLADIRIEGRKYWNTKNIPQAGVRDDLTKIKDSIPLKYLWSRAFNMERVNPRTERGYYAGFYLGYHNYSFKFGSKGYQGNAFSAGLTAGFMIPLYTYKRHVIDLDLGGSLGLFYTDYDTYRYDAESNCYPIASVGNKAVFPMVTELRVGLVYRFESVRKKILTDVGGYEARQDSLAVWAKNRKDSLEAKRLRKRQAYVADSLHRDSVRRDRKIRKAAEEYADSLERLEKIFKRDSLRRLEYVEDSLKQASRDSLRREEWHADSLKRVQQEVRKDSIRQEKLRSRKEKKRKRAEEDTPPLSSDSLQTYRRSVTDDRLLAIRIKRKEI